MQHHHEPRKQETGAEIKPQPDVQSHEGDQQGTTGNSPLEERLARMESELAETQNAFLRAKAEVENMRRRAQEDVSNAHKYAIESFAETLLPVKDSMETALSVGTPSIESLKEGVDMTLKQLSSAFEKNRVTEVNPSPGDKFDPDRHQAVLLVPANQPPNTVANVMQKGYMIADRLLRPALVAVAQPSSNGASG